MGTERRLKTEGAIDQVAGKARQMAGILSDDEVEESRGKAQATGGKLKSKAGRAIEDVKNVVRDI